MVSKKLRIFGGITILAGSWLQFIIEIINGRYLVDGYAYSNTLHRNMARG